MKKILVLSSIFALALGMSFAAQADDTASSSMAPAAAMTPSSSMAPASDNNAMSMTGKHHMKKGGACMAIASACESAGFRLSKTPGKNIWHDCVKPLVAGQTVSGVTADPKDLDACKNHMDKWKAHKMAKMQQNQNATPSVQSQQ